MKKQTVFIKVKCSDKLPKESGFYQTNFGPRHFLVGCGRWVGCEPQFWFQEIELPIEEEIQSAAPKTRCVNQFWNGANFILNKLKVETK